MRLVVGTSAFVFIFIFILLVACASEEQSPVNTNVHPELFRDRDALFQRVELMHDFDAITYTEEQLDRLREEPESGDYKAVVQQFVTRKLNKEIESFQTLDAGDRFRTLVVITTDRTFYRIGLEKLDEHDGIYVVSHYAELIWQSYPIPEVDEDQI